MLFISMLVFQQSQKICQPVSRPLRIAYPGAWYHIIDRCYAGQTLFRNDTDRQTFLRLCAHVSEVYAIEIHAYCLLENCFHLLVHTPRANISQAMRHLLSHYSQYYNQVENREGPLFAGRYKSILTEDDEHLLQVSRYIHRQPKVSGLTPVIANYPWSSYPEYINKRKPSIWLHNNSVLNFMASANGKAIYRIYVETGKDPETEQFYKTARIPAILGSHSFKKQATANQSFDLSELPQARQILQRPAIKTIITEVAQQYSVPIETIKACRRGRGEKNLPRSIALYLCRNIGGHSLKIIAENFNMNHYSAVSVAIKRLTTGLADNPALLQQLTQIRDKLLAQENTA